MSPRPVWALASALIALLAVANAQSPTAPHGAYLGCFDPAKLALPDRAAPAKFAAYSVRKCAGYCRGKGHALNVITRALECHCTSVIPDEGARLAEAACAANAPAGAPAGVALFYNHLNAADKGCRLANVKMEKNSFNFHYNDYHATFDNGVMTLKMEGSNGLRFTTNDGKHLYGMFQVTGRTTTASGAVTAFYTRSSDDYNTDNHGDFDEIDFEFLNGDPSVPAGLWLNSFHKGMSGGERLVKPDEYRPKLKLNAGADAGTDFLTYTINWQPDQVAWFANNELLLRRHYGQRVAWKDMKGVPFKRDYRPPTEPQHVTFSMWADQDQNRAFGGKLDWAKSPFTSQFKDLRRVLCDAAPPAANGPAWLYPAEPPAKAPPSKEPRDRSPKQPAEKEPKVPAKLLVEKPSPKKEPRY